VEQERASDMLDAELIWAALQDCTLSPDATLVSVIEKEILRTGADVVYVHAPDDTHQDHRATASATLSAARMSCRILHYRSPSTIRFHPTFFVDISAHLDAKLAALRCHRSQVEGSSMVDPEVVEASARYFGAIARVRHAEPFAPGRFVWDLQPGRGGAESGRADEAAGQAVPPPRRAAVW